MQALPRLSLIGPPHSRSPLHHTLTSQGPGLSEAGGSMGSGAQTSGRCLTMRAAMCLGPHLDVPLPTPTSTWDAPGPVPALLGPGVPETTSEGPGCRLPLPPTRRRRGNPRLQMAPELWQETLCRHHRPSPGSPGTQANSKGTRRGGGPPVGKQLFSTNLFSPTFLKSNSTI